MLAVRITLLSIVAIVKPHAMLEEFRPEVLRSPKSRELSVRRFLVVRLPKAR